MSFLTRHYYFIACLCLFLPAVGSHALDTSLEFGLGGVSTDNSNLVDGAANPQDDVIYEASASLQLDADQPAYIVDLDYFGRSRQYQDQTQDDENLFTGRSFLRWNALSERLNWDVLHVRGNILRDTRLANTNNNREVRDVVSTGPDIRFRVSSVDDVVLRLRYSDISFEFSKDSDNTRNGGQLLWRHALTKVSDLSLDMRLDDAEYSSNLEQRFLQLALIYEVQLRRGRYRFRVGRNEAKNFTGSDFSGPLLQFNAEHDIGNGRVALYYQRELTDTSIGLVDGIITRDDFLLDEAVSGNFAEIDLLEQESASLRFTTQLCRRCRLSVGINYSNLDYKSLPRDEESVNGSLSLRYNVNRKLNMTVAASQARNRFLDQVPQREDDVLFYSIAFDYRWSNSLRFRLLTSREDRNSNLDGFDFVENRIELGFTYYWGGANPVQVKGSLASGANRP